MLATSYSELRNAVREQEQALLEADTELKQARRERDLHEQQRLAAERALQHHLDNHEQEQRVSAQALAHLKQQLHDSEAEYVPILPSLLMHPPSHMRSVLDNHVSLR